MASDHTILVLGDSLSAALGIRPEQGWVALLAQRLQAQGYGYQIVNASVSGETTSGGLERLPRALQLHQPGTVILELGANDGLRGLPVETTRANLDQIIEMLQSEGSKVVLAGMTLPPNYGPDYIKPFQQVYVDLAAKYKVTRIPFLLSDVALHAELMQRDGIHPTAQGNEIVAKTVMHYLKPLLH